MRLSLACILLLVGSLCIVRAYGGNDTFEGKWKIKVEPDEDARRSGAKPFDDTLNFKANKFWSDELKKKGFAESEYETDERSFGPATFVAKPKSEKEGEVKWSGTITVHEVTGELIWTKKDGTELHYSFKGSKS